MAANSIADSKSGGFCQTESSHGQNAMVLQWQELLLKNDIELDTLEETQELLFLIMDFVMEILTAFIVNDWDEKQLLKVYRMRIKWLKNGIQK